MRGNFMKRLLCVMMVIALLGTYTVPVFAADNASATFKQVDNSKVSATLSDREPVELPEEEAPYADSDVVRVSIVLEKAGTIEAGFSTMNIAGNDAAMNYRTQLEKDQTTLIGKIEKAISSDLDVVWNLTLAANLISANVEYGQIEAIEQVAGVKSVLVETRYEPDVVSSGDADPNMATSGKQIGSSAVWAAGYTGAGTKIAIIDTGADVEHEAFDAAAFDYAIEQLGGSYDLMDASDIEAVLSELNAYKRAGYNAEDLYVNSKVPFGFNYIDRDLDIVHVNDPQGEHGSHVAGIATANSYVNNGDGTFSAALDTTYVQGVAPEAQLMVMKVFGKGGGAYDSDYMAAIEDAVILGADSVNLSLGSGNPGMSAADGGSDELGYYQDLLDSLEKSGVVVAISAGNSGYWVESADTGIPYLYQDDVSFQTNGSPGSFTNAFTVASVDNDGFTATYFTVDGTIVSYNETSGYGNEPMTTLAGTQEYVFVDSIGEAADFEAVGDLTGKIVMCYRGTTSFYEKANNAAAAGAAGIVIVNNEAGIINMNLEGYEYTAPCVSITQALGEVFKTAGTENTTESGITYWTGSMEVSASMGTGQYNSEYYTMSSFSSWGVPGSLELKPEITAPGGNIYSVAGAINDGSFSDHASYELMSGTSMAAPQVTGMAALVAQYIRETGLDKQTGLDERTLAQSLLMSTAVPMRDGNSYGNYYPVIQQGAGLANVGAATTADSYIIMGSDATDSWEDGKVKAELGDDPEKTGVYTFSFTLNNLTDEEKTFALTADVFTQDSFTYEDISLLDTWTIFLSPDVTWAVDGKEVTTGEELIGMDFNGDGAVNSADGQILLDYATGLDVTLSKEYMADLNMDDVINSYDAYMFFSMLNAGGAVVPANGSAEVTVTITLSEDDKWVLGNYPNGAYIEAYIYAQSLATAEGVEGTTHSIPVLGFYGNWSDASMFDKGSYAEFDGGVETRPPYLYYSTYAEGLYNGLTITYADDPNSEYWFGGNPMVSDDTYMPERNAISGVNGDVISSLGFTAIRNAADSYVYVADMTAGEYLAFQQTGAVDSAYYYTNGGVWRNTFYSLGLGVSAESLAEDTALEIGMILVPEYYVAADGTVDLEALGDGATFSMPMVVDNTAPVLESVDINTETNTLDIVTTDNQYIAAVALYDIYGQYLYTYAGSVDQNAGDTVSYALDLSEVNGPSFLLQVYDYAMNTTTYEINTQIGDVTDTIESIELDQTYLVMKNGTTDALSAIVYPVNAVNRAVTWSSSDDSVVSVDENGNLTANNVGTATVTATSVADTAVTASCEVEVIDINVDLNGIVWDEEGSIWFSQFNTQNLPNYDKLSPDMLGEDYFVAATVAPDGTLYASSLNSSTGTGSLYTVDPETYAVTKLTDCVVQDTAIFYSDLTYAPSMYETGALLAAYGPFVISIDPATGEAIEIIDQYDGDLVGIAIVDSLLQTASDGTVVYQDLVYAIQNDGTVYSEIYYGYDGVVVPYNDYFEGTRVSMSTGISVNDAWYYNSAYYDNNYLYWSAFDVSTQNVVTLYAIDADNTGNAYVLGQFGDGVWPVGGLYQMEAAASADGSKIEDTEVLAIEAEEIQLAAKEFPVKETKAGGSLNAVTAANKEVFRPMSDVTVGDNTVTVTVTAKDVNGSAITSTNGVTTVTYDANALTLSKIQVAGDYTAVNKADGAVTFGYVSLDGIDADAAVATLVFEVKDDSVESVTVTQKEVNDVTSTYEETLSFSMAKEIASGWSGNTAWTLTDDGVLTVSPTGVTYEGKCSMKNYGFGTDQPWRAYADQITSIVVEEGVNVIGSGAFKDLTKVESVKLPDSGLQTIEVAAFYGCSSLPEIYIPDSVYTVWGYTFKNCTSLSSIRLPKYLCNISDGAFENCTAMSSIYIPGNTAIIGYYSFKGCTALESVDMQWADATEIRAGAFKNCTALTSVILPADIQTLGESAFYGIGATTFTVPETVTAIGGWCFARSALSEITFEGDAPTFGDGVFNKISLTAYYPGDNATWTADIMQNYGGTVTWTAK